MPSMHTTVELTLRAERSVRLSLIYTFSSWMFSLCLFKRVKKARDLQRTAASLPH